MEGVGVCSGITFTLLHASTSDLTYYLIPIRRMFSHVFWPTFASAVTLKLTEATIPAFQLIRLIRLPCCGRVALSCLRFVVATASVDSAVNWRSWVVCCRSRVRTSPQACFRPSLFSSFFCHSPPQDFLFLSFFFSLIYPLPLFLSTQNSSSCDNVTYLSRNNSSTVPKGLHVFKI